MRAGRNRKAGAREPNGRIVRGLRDRASIGHRQRDLDAIRVLRLDPALGTPVGELARSGQIPARLFDAATKYAALRAAADRAHGLPRRSASALDYNVARGLGLHEPCPDRDQAVIAALREADVALGVGSAAWQAVQHAAVHERAPDFAMRQPLMVGLDLLASHWGLT